MCPEEPVRLLVKVLLTVVGMAACGWLLIPRSDHDMTHVDGLVLFAGQPVAGAIVSLSFPAPSRGGGDEEVSDSRGCVHLMARHSRTDRRVQLRVEYLGAPMWSQTVPDHSELVAEVHLDSDRLGGRAGGLRRPAFPRDTALGRCHEPQRARGG